LTSGEPEAMRRDMMAAARAGADAVECRLDFLAEIPPRGQLQMLLSDPPVEVIVTCRPTREGGRFAGEESRRLELLRLAGELGAPFVDVEFDVPRASWPKAQVILSHHDLEGCPREADSIAARMDASPAAVNKLAFTARGPEDALRAFDLIRACRKPTMALAMEEHGVMSRILARKFGAFGTFASLSEGARSAPGQPTIEQFRKLYRWDSIGAGTAVYGVIGCPVAHSLSPAIHNAAFAATGMDAVYVPLRIEPGSESFNRFMDALLERPWMDWRGLSVTIPHKENALACVGAENCDELTRRIGAVNTIAVGPGRHGLLARMGLARVGGVRGRAASALRGCNTDYAAAIDALCSGMGIPREGLRGRRVAVLGAGGAARATVAALTHYRAAVTIYNRTVERARRLAGEFTCSAAPIDKAPQSTDEIIINCTPIGMHPHVDATPLERIPRTVKVVFDTIYDPLETRLLRDAACAGCLTVRGLDMFVNQAVAQFEFWTGLPAPRDVMRRVVSESIALPRQTASP
jgi:3-dehydroquinate dehydratase/shikimate dehydrogenase